MLMMENELLEDFHLDPKALEYLVHNEKQASVFYCPAINGRFYIVQVADKDVDVILNWGKGKFVYQGDRFGQIRHGSQCDVCIPRKPGIDYEFLVKPLDHVEAGIDPILRIIKGKK
jgi:phosphatidylserine decarboxylase